MLKHCPFCKKEVGQSDSKCPHCGMTIRESLYSDTRNSNSSKNDQGGAAKQKPNVFKRIKANLVSFLYRFKTRKVGHSRSDSYKKCAVMVMTCLFAYGLYSDKPQVIVTEQKTIQLTSDAVSNLTFAVQPEVIIPPPNTGTIIKRDYSRLKGNGELRISNGTSLDAVAKLVYTDRSVYSVYIRAGSEYTIKNISDGYYNLMFALGTNWHNDTKVFGLNNAYSKFDESFDFITRDSAEGIRYRVFEVTLNPVIGGQAETASVDPVDFNSY